MWNWSASSSIYSRSQQGEGLLWILCCFHFSSEYRDQNWITLLERCGDTISFGQIFYINLLSNSSVKQTQQKIHNFHRAMAALLNSSLPLWTWFIITLLSMQWMQYWEDFSIDERKICACGNFSQQTMSFVTEWDSVQINRTVDQCNWEWINHF